MESVCVHISHIMLDMRLEFCAYRTSREEDLLHHPLPSSLSGRHIVEDVALRSCLELKVKK